MNRNIWVMRLRKERHSSKSCLRLAYANDT